MPRPLKLYIAALCLVIVLGPVLLVAGIHGRVAVTISLGLTALIMFGMLGYAVFFDSKRRWPECSRSERFTYVMTFGTPPRYRR